LRILISVFFVSAFTFLAAVYPAKGFGAEADFKSLCSEHFLINYQPGVSQDYVYSIKDVAEKYYRIITQEFNFIRDELWLWENRAKVFIADNKENYLTQFRCSSWSGACVNYLAKIIYTYPDQERFNPIFIHELTHIILHEYLKKNSLDSWLDEGVACYIEDKYGRELYQTRMRQLKQLIKNNQYIPFKELLAANTASLDGNSANYAGLFYIESFSIINFFVKQYGRNNFSRFLSYLKHGDSIKTAMAKAFSGLNNIEEMEGQWAKFYLK